MGHHTPADSGAPAEPTTLSEHLLRSATVVPGAIALCHKTRGRWIAWTWRDWRTEVGRVVAALSARGFRPGDVVAIGAAPSPQALAVTLAAHTLGGVALWTKLEGYAPVASPSVAEPRFGFAQDESALAKLRTRLGLGGSWTLGLHTADHGSPDDPAAPVRGYAAAVAPADPAADGVGWARPQDVAFVFPDRVAGPSTSTHAALLAQARAWLVARGSIGRLAFTAEAPTSAAVAAFFAGWLVGGFSLGLPEDPTTADLDRRELQPEVVAATAPAYERLARQVTDGLPPVDTFLRRTVDAGLASAKRWGQWTMRRPLRDVMGFRAAKTALVLGAPPPAAAQELFASLRIALWPLAARAPGPDDAVYPEAGGAADSPAALSPPAATLGELT